MNCANANIYQFSYREEWTFCLFFSLSMNSCFCPLVQWKITITSASHKHLLQFRLTSSSWWFPSILIFSYSFKFIRFYSDKCIIINKIFVFAVTMGRCQLLSLVDFVEWLIFIYFCVFFSFVFGFNNKIDVCEWRIQSIKVLKQSTIIVSAWREQKKKWLNGNKWREKIVFLECEMLQCENYY